MTSNLNGKRIVITRAAHQAGEFSTLLKSHGAIPVAYPCIAITPPEDSQPLDDALEAAAGGAFDWLVLTSANAAMIVGERLRIIEERSSETITDAALRLEGRPYGALGGETTLQGVHLYSPTASTVSAFLHLKVIAIGAVTAQNTEAWLGREVDCIAEEANSRGITNTLAALIQPGARVLLAASEIAHAELPERLTEMGAEVTSVTAYRTVIGSGGEDVPALLREGHIDAVAFTSPSTAHYFLIRFAQEGGRRSDLTGVNIVCIGGTTARAVEAAGFRVNAIARQQTMIGLVDALEQATFPIQ